jgi:hypothetical protein
MPPYRNAGTPYECKASGLSYQHQHAQLNYIRADLHEWEALHTDIGRGALRSAVLTGPMLASSGR